MTSSRPTVAPTPPGATANDRMLTSLDTVSARRWAVVTRAAFAARRAEIDALNVFPVPDGDTGTNLYLTFDAGLDSARVDYEERGLSGERPEDVELAKEAEVFARSLLLSARGNSGVILSQIFRGFADEVSATGVRTMGGAGLASAIARADRLAWSSVAHPVEGTILSVSRAAATAAGELTETDPQASLYDVTVAVLAAAQAALARTPEQLPVLAHAGVVDAGGAGYVLLLEALERVVTGDVDLGALVRDDPLKRRAGWAQPAVTPSMPGGDLVEGGPSYEVMFLLSDATADAVETLRRRLDALGDSLLIVGGDELHNVHVHVDDVGAAVEAAIEAGRPHRIRVTHFQDQRQQARRDESAVAVVACAAGEGLAGIFRSAGAWVVPSGPRRRASAGQFLDAAQSTRAQSVIVLPNDGDTVLAANAAAKVGAQEGLDIKVVASRTAVQGIAALAVFDGTHDLADNVLAMSSAAAATRHGAVTVATKDALTSAGPCHQGDVLGIVDGDIVVVGADLNEVAGEVVDRLLASGGELLTVVAGEDAPQQLSEQVAAAAHIRRRDVEVSHVYGGQPAYPLLLGVE